MVSWTKARSHLARAVQTGQPPEVIDQARREYLAALLAHRITAVVPHLTQHQRGQLADLVLTGDGADGH